MKAIDRKKWAFLDTSKRLQTSADTFKHLQTLSNAFIYLQVPSNSLKLPKPRESKFINKIRQNRGIKYQRNSLCKFSQSHKEETIPKSFGKRNRGLPTSIEARSERELSFRRRFSAAIKSPASLTCRGFVNAQLFLPSV